MEISHRTKCASQLYSATPTAVVMTSLSGLLGRLAKPHCQYSSTLHMYPLSSKEMVLQSGTTPPALLDIYRCRLNLCLAAGGPDLIKTRRNSWRRYACAQPITPRSTRIHEVPPSLLCQLHAVRSSQFPTLPDLLMTTTSAAARIPSNRQIFWGTAKSDGGVPCAGSRLRIETAENQRPRVRVARALSRTH